MLHRTLIQTKNFLKLNSVDPDRRHSTIYTSLYEYYCYETVSLWGWTQAVLGFNKRYVQALLDVGSFSAEALVLYSRY